MRHEGRETTDEERAWRVGVLLRWIAVLWQKRRIRQCAASYCFWGCADGIHHCIVKKASRPGWSTSAVSER